MSASNHSISDHLRNFQAENHRFRTFLKRSGSLATTVYLINGIFHVFLKTSLSVTASVIAPLVLLEEHIVVNLYLAYKNKGIDEKDWSLSPTEKKVFAFSLIILNTFLYTSMINVFSAPLIYRAIPLSWAVGVKLATFNVIFDLFTTY